MNSETVLQVILWILINNFDWLADIDSILPEHRLRDDLELDSLAMVNLQVALEDELDMRFDPIEIDLAEVFETVESLADFLVSYLGKESVG